MSAWGPGIPGIPNEAMPVIAAKHLAAHDLLEASPLDMEHFCLEYHDNLLKEGEVGGARMSILSTEFLKAHIVRLQRLYTHSEGANGILIHP